MEQEWISVNDDLPKDDEMVLVWQDNLSDKECSRWQKALYHDYSEDIKLFEVYPILFREDFLQCDDFIGSDLEGDKVQVTHWMQILKSPSEKHIKKFKGMYVFTISDEEICGVSIAKKVDFDKGHEASIDLPRSMYDKLEDIGCSELMEGVFEVSDITNVRESLIAMGMTENINKQSND